MRVRSSLITALAALSFLAVSCRDASFEPTGADGGSTDPGARHAVEQQRHVMIMVSGGHNSISSYLTEDLEDIAEGFVPAGTDAATNALVIISRLPVNQLSTTSAPVVYRMYRDEAGAVVRDTMRTFSTDDRLFGGDVMREALETVKHRLPAKSYGMVLSSHASGWLPSGYYENPSNFERTASRRSIGQDKDGSVSVEMELMDFTAALPFRMSYVVLDCCLSGGVEVAWALRGKTDVVAFTQTETMADGFDYKSIVSRLLEEDVPNPLGVCQDFYNYYMAKTGVHQSATISLVAPDKMDALAAVCSALFEKYREALLSLNGDGVQRYFRYDRHYFYDLRDILVKAGVSSDELAQLDAALGACVLYKAATPYFMKDTMYGFRIHTACGLSMYLPSMGSAFLNNHYINNIAWNQATQLVK